jgi:predicted alpha/beta-fold hydrolase
VPAPIYTDPDSDAKNPASTSVLHIPSHGVLINGLLYSPPGSGPHPTFVLCHGLPGNEKNLDLAQAVRRAGWNAVTFNYRTIMATSSVATDQSWDDHRIALEGLVIRWLATMR